MKRRLQRIYPWLCVLLLATCNESTGPDHNLDLDALFARPTAAEMTAVRSDWNNRPIVVAGVREEFAGPFLLGFVPARLRIVSHMVGGFRHYGAIIRPSNADAGTLGVLVYAHGGDRGFSVDEVALLAAGLGDAADEFVFVAPSFRSEELRYGSQRWQSDGDASPWDRDVDDALAVLRVAYQTELAADSTRTGVVGLSRGGNVGMLMGIRDPGIDAVIEFFGPTDFFGEFARDVFEQSLSGSPPDFPGMRHLNDHVIQPVAKGEITMAAARLEMLRRSAAYFAPSLARLQVHHGTADPIVPVSQAHDLDREMRAAGRTSPSYAFHIYNGGDHNPLTLVGSIERTGAFLSVITTPLRVPPTCAPDGLNRGALRNSISMGFTSAMCKKGDSGGFERRFGRSVRIES